MKIMVCGKGGCGKSTISTLLALELAARNKNVLVVDMDESNFGLHRQLGTELPKDFTLYFGSKKGVYKALDAEGSNGTPYDHRWTMEDIPEEFTAHRDSIRLMAIGKIHTAGEGCACAMGTVAKTFLENLDLGENDFVIADAEAGVEHFGRGVDAGADAIIMMVDPSYESLQLSKKIKEMGDTIGKPVYYILNKVTPEQAHIIKKTMTRPESILGIVPVNEELLTWGLLGQRIESSIPEIESIVDQLIK